MFRTAIYRSAGAFPRLAVSKTISTSLAARPSSLFRPSQFAVSRSIPTFRCYSAPAGLGKPEVEGRIIDLLKNFDKVNDPSKLSAASHFANDLGLDSLDTVEVVMAIEEEFSIEIPDKDADAIHSISQAVEYILAQPDAH